MLSSSSRNERRIAGALLVLGFGLLMVRAALVTLDDASLSRGSADALQAGLITTILGMAILELALQKAGQQVLGRLGAIAYLIGTLGWLVAAAMGTFTFELERNYVLLACVSVAAYAWAMLRPSSSLHLAQVWRSSCSACFSCSGPANHTIRRSDQAR